MNIVKTIVALLVGTFAFGANGNADNRTDKNGSINMEGKRVLVAYFSRADENYGVGRITVGNTAKVAEVIAEETRGTLFHIETVEAYAADYRMCVDEAKREQQAGVRPEIKGDADVEGYDVIFLGYPNWWGDCPMAVYTFIERHNWAGKTVVPFCTHEGSGLSGTESKIRKATGATVLKGLALRGTTAQNDRDATVEAVRKWIRNL